MPLTPQRLKVSLKIAQFYNTFDDDYEFEKDFTKYLKESYLWGAWHSYGLVGLFGLLVI